MQHIVAQDERADPSGTAAAIQVDHQPSSSGAAVGNIEAFQGDTMADAGSDDYRVVVAQARLVRRLGAHGDALGEIARQDNLTEIITRAHQDRVAIRHALQGMGDGSPRRTSRAITARVASISCYIVCGVGQAGLASESGSPRLHH